MPPKPMAPASSVSTTCGRFSAESSRCQVAALSQFDTNYALVENAGAKLRALDEANKVIKTFPSNGFVALEETLKTKREQSVAVARGYAMGTVFAMANPEAAIRTNDLIEDINKFDTADIQKQARAYKGK